MSVMLSFGHGYCARALTPVLLARSWEVIGTTRSEEKAKALEDEGVTPAIFGTDLSAAIARATHVLISAGPGEDGDPVLNAYGEMLERHLGAKDWVGYLSTTGVYGDHEGRWVDEDTPLTPSTQRGRLRVKAEAAWRDLAARTSAPLHIFRLAGIYGPGRGPFAKVRAGTARRIVKPGQVFSRIHVDDIAQVLAASIDRPDRGRIYNLCDDDPAPPQDVIAHAAKLLGLPLPPQVTFDEAEMSPMARSFYAESKRVRNDRIKQELGVRLRYPDYRTGLSDLLRRERGG
ncbi:NAD dependent epimerase/dehydratase family protein [Jannaschia seosinensis]|uniref:NAD dependent epimerase/dehydratase family protein n=1 Tax=Jannaschia seosinensis TaxID=313367 RepID=A0A0M7BAS6_9RHOB|nr:SDR family oxidoreductase [Jannaschia seosinensis]CUH38922.1 NAD dependent epimerase/dehydratase family protein [Jannaschia seosinensis]